MLRTNLATRPFYNERAVRLGLGLVAAIALGLSAFNAAQILSLTSRHQEFAARADAAEAKAADLRNQARITRQALDKEEVGAVRAAAREANLLIQRRAFSWTDLFNQFEETLPADVRVTAVQPQLDDEGRMLVAINTIARRIEDLHSFVDRLEETGAFRGVLSRQAELQDDNTQRAVIQGYYEPERAPAATSAPPSSESGREQSANASGNAPPAAPVPPIDPSTNSGSPRGESKGEPPDGPKRPGGAQ